MNTLPDINDRYAALRFRNFRLLILGRFAGQIGEMMVSVGVGWELYERTRDPFALGLVGLVQVIPVLLLSLIGGYFADIYDRRRLTMISQIVLIFCSVALIGLSAVQGPLWLLYTVLAVIGIARAFNNPAEGALTPQTIPREYFFNAATWSSAVWQLSAILGPAIAGIIIAVAKNAIPVYAANVIGGSVFVWVLLNIKIKSSAEKALVEPPLQSLRAGISFVRNTPVILASITLDMFAVLFGGAVFLLPVYAKDVLMVDATGLGILRAAPSVGALLMAAFLTRRPAFGRSGLVLLGAVAGFGIATVGFAVSTSLWLSAFFLALTGALDNISVVIRSTLLVTRTPDAMRGRVNSVNMIFIGASNELGGFESGLAAAVLGTVPSVIFGGIGTLVVVALIAIFVPDIRRLDRLIEPRPTEEDLVAREVLQTQRENPVP